MIDINKVISLSSLLYGIDPEDENLYLMAQTLCGQVQYRMNKNTDCDDVRILHLCAAELNYRLLLRNISSDDGVTSFKAGDVSVSLSPDVRMKKSEEELQRAVLSAAPLLRDEGFSFRKV